MATTRIKKKVFTGVTEKEAVQAAREFASATFSIAMCEAEINQQISDVQKKYEKKLADLRKKLVEPSEKLEAFANQTKEDWGKKSRDLTHCVIGFRTGTPKVIKKKGSPSWEKILVALKAANLLNYIRTKDELNKESILAEKDETMINQLRENHILVDQDETFFIEAKSYEATA